jgi:hypothetical protein
MNEQALKIRMDQIRLIGHLPFDIEVLKPLSSWEGNHEDWIVSGLMPALYLHIRHRYCYQMIPGAHLLYEDIDKFLERYAELLSQELKEGP